MPRVCKTCTGKVVLVLGVFSCQPSATYERRAGGQNKISSLTISKCLPDKLRPAAASLVEAEVKATKPVEEATLDPAPCCWFRIRIRVRI